MSKVTAKYITTTLPYVNASPHVGFALEMVQADTLARHWRLMGHEVFFNTGTDEHGQKIAEKADAAGEERQTYVDHYAAQFDELKSALNLSYDAFIRTTSDTHKEAAQEMWRRCDAAGDIYKKTYHGLYCVGCEVFYKASELEEGNVCPIHQKVVEEVEEENYFFRLSRFETELTDLLKDESRTIPSWQREWALSFVQNGLEDISISRRKERMDWGVPVPGDDEHVMYVWFDALTNYISTLGWPTSANAPADKSAFENASAVTPASEASATNLFETFWVNGHTLQMAGKDQVRFQSIIFQAMLCSAGLPLTDQIFYHGFINVDGQKMSKSLGNVISPYEMVEKYGTDATRYILLRHVHSTDDSDITWEKMDEWYTANLVNGLGNLTSRIMKMAEMHLDAPIERPKAADFDEEYMSALDRYDFQGAADYVWSRIGALDEKITETEPFKLVKEDKAAAQALIQELVSKLYLIARMLNPLMPETNKVVKEAVLQNKKPDNLFTRLND